MKQEVVPTSPKSELFGDKKKQKEEKKTGGASRHLAFAVIVISLLFGAAAGFFGFMIAANIPASVPVLGELNVISLLEEERQDILLSSRSPEQSIVKQAPHVIDQVVVVYADAPTVKDPSTFIGNAVILTADGWMAMPTSLFPVNEAGEKDTVVAVILSDGTTTEIEKTVDDAYTGVTFFKVSAQNLPVVFFDEAEAIPIGQTFSIIEKEIGSFVVYERQSAGELYRSNVARNTITLEQLAVLDSGSQTNRVGSPVFTNNGNLLGMVMTDGTVMQSSLMQGALSSLLATGEIKRSTKEITYINISRLTDEEKEARELAENGLLVVSVKKDEAAVAGDVLKKGDVITSINNAFVDEAVDLGVTIHSIPAESTLYFTVLRDGEEKHLEFHT
ncbi:PDZ domain-containing protein [Patescibacteria group bacterium]